MKACDNRAPLEIRNKAKWIEVERLRWARQFHIPMAIWPPEGFPSPSTLRIMRFLTALQMTRPDLVPVALDKLYAAVWGTDEEGSAGSAGSGGGTGGTGVVDSSPSSTSRSPTGNGSGDAAQFNQRSGLHETDTDTLPTNTTSAPGPEVRLDTPLADQFNARSGISFDTQAVPEATRSRSQATSGSGGIANPNSGSERRSPSGSTPRRKMSTLTDPVFFSALLSQVLDPGLVRETLAKSNSADVKKKLSENTDSAFQDGAFGLPWFQCRNARGEVEGFWGFDHLGQVVRFMGLDIDGSGEKQAESPIRALL